MKDKVSVGICFAFLAAFLWSTGGVGIKVLSLDGFQVAAFRSFIAALFLLPFFRLGEIKWNKTLVGFLLAFTWMSASFVISTKLTTAANAIALQYTSVFWVFLIDELPVKKTIPKEKIIPFILVLLGILFYMTEQNTGTNVLGNVLGLSSGLGFGVVVVLLRRLSLPNGKSVICLANGVVFIILFLIMLIMGFNLPDVKNVVFELSILIYLGVFQIATAYIVFNKALQSISALTGSFVALSEPVLNPIWVYLFLKEVPTFHGIMGWICLMISVFIYLLTLNHQNSKINPSLADEKLKHFDSSR